MHSNMLHTKVVLCWLYLALGIKLSDLPSDSLISYADEIPSSAMRPHEASHAESGDKGLRRIDTRNANRN